MSLRDFRGGSACPLFRDKVKGQKDGLLRQMEERPGQHVSDEQLFAIRFESV